MNSLIKKNNDLISSDEIFDVNQFFELKAKEDNELFGDFGKSFNRIAISETGRFYSITNGDEQDIGDNFDCVILLQSIWFSYYNPSTQTYPIRSNQLKAFDGYVRLIDDNSDSGIVFEGPYNKFKEFILKEYPDETFNRLHMKDGIKKSFVTATRFVYLLKDDVVYRMTVSKVAYGTFKDPADGTLLKLYKDTKFLYNKYIVNISTSSETIDKKVVFRPKFKVKNEITDIDTLIKIAKLRMFIEGKIFSDQDEIREKYNSTLLEVDNAFDELLK